MPDNGLNKIRGFVVSELNGEPLKGIAVSLVARYSSSGSGPIDKPIDKIFPGAKFEESASSDQSKTVNKEKTQRVTLGVLYSDNVGYFSFDNPMSSALHQSLVILELFCPYDPDLKAKGPITIGQGKDFLEALHSLNPLVFEIRVNPKIPTACHKKVLSIQKPDYMDWEISPKSFVDVTAPVIGEDDCQKFLN
ncbi:MAG: hypothetical protein NTW97_01210, partial [Candidatus Krumholzibacteria bacterium]|nr:hypothetical protein [Candidatus Krumholzibacteria bacterium]